MSNDLFSYFQGYRERLVRNIAKHHGNLAVSAMSAEPWRVAASDGVVLSMNERGEVRFGFDGLAGFACFARREDAQRLADAWNENEDAKGFQVSVMSIMQLEEARLAHNELLLRELDKAMAEIQTRKARGVAL